MRRKRPENQAEEELIESQRRLLVAVAVMVVVLISAMLVARLSWTLQERRQTRDTSPNGRLPEQIQHVDTNTGIRSDAALPADVQIQNLLEQAERMSRAGQYDEAAAAYRKALTLDGQQVDTWIALGRSYFSGGDDIRARDALKQALELDSSNVDAQTELAVVYLHQRRLQEAFDILETLLVLGEERPRLFLLHALCKKAQSNWIEAEESLRAYLAIEPGEPFALKELAFVEASQGNYEAALRHLQDALVTAPDWPGLHLDAAATCALSGREDLAMKYLRTALDLSSPGVVYRTFRQPAFQEIRRSEAGQAFEAVLARAARESLKEVPEEGPAHTFPAAPEPVELFSP